MSYTRRAPTADSSQLTDWILQHPSVDGGELLAQLRRRWPTATDRTICAAARQAAERRREEAASMLTEARSLERLAAARG